MTRDKLVAWLSKKPAGAAHVQLVCEHLGNDPTVVASWERAELDSHGDGEVALVADAMLEQAQEFTDAEGTPQKFLVRWLGGHERPLKSVTHRVMPSAPGEGEARPSLLGGPMAEVMVRDALRSMSEKDRSTNSALSEITRTYNATLTMLTGQLDSAYRRLAELEAERRAPTRVELTPEQREESVQRARALEALIEKLPEVVDTGLAVLANRLLPAKDGAGRHDA